MDSRLRDQGSYLRVKANLDEIAEKIRDKDLPLEQALDLYEEAIRLGNSCADLIDTTDFSADELEVYNGGESVEDGGSDAER